MGVTIKDIARQAGMSVSAVSLVLNNRPCRISEAKKQEIREIAARLQYQPNQMARSLVTKETKMLALILPDIENIFFSSLAKRIEDGCRREGYLLIIANSGDRSAEDRALLHSIAARGVDGIFLIVSNESYRDNTALLAELGGLSIPFVMVDRVYEDFVCDQVLFDNEEGGYLAARHLIGMGHTRIGCIANTAANNGRARLRGLPQGHGGGRARGSGRMDRPRRLPDGKRLPRGGSASARRANRRFCHQRHDGAWLSAPPLRKREARSGGLLRGRL